MNTTCPVCQSDFEKLYTIERFARPLSILYCPACGLQRQETFPPEEELYTEDYYQGRSEYSYRDERTTEKYDRFVWRARLKTIQRYRPPPARLLDVGCAFGGFLGEAREAGYEVQGLDVSPYAAKSARERGLPVLQGSFGPGIFAPASFDVISLVEVVEHLADPLSFARSLFEYLRPGGLALIQTANFLGQQARRAGREYHYYLPGHLFYYSSRNLQQLLRGAGFDRFVLYRPVDFGLWPKLRKAAGNSGYRSWRRITMYHLKSKLAFRDFALTSSMVLYAFKPELA